MHAQPPRGVRSDAGAVVFVSYSRDDAPWRGRFVNMLNPLVRQRRLETWSDERLVIGEKWRPQLDAAIARSHAALLLVSEEFLASSFIFEHELPALLERGVPLVPVLVGPCAWQGNAVLEEWQWAHDPNRDGALALADDPNGQIVRVCLRLIELVLPGELAELVEDVSASGSTALAPALRAGDALLVEGLPGELHGVPALPAAFVARDELAGLVDAVLAASGHGVGVTGKAPGVHGQGGIGKSVLAAALARDPQVRRHFPDGIYWVTVGERADLVAVQLDLLARLGETSHDELRSAIEAVDVLRAALAERQCLVVVDDVWSVAAAQAFAAAGPRGRLLYTTRDAAILGAIGAHVQPVDVLPRAAARELLAGLAGIPAEALPAEADRVLTATGRVALALSLVGSAVGREGRTWSEVVEELERGTETYLDHPYANAFNAMQVAIGALGGELERAYATLAVYPADTSIPVAAVARYWSALSASAGTLEQTRAQLETLAARGLLSLDDDAISFHDLQRDFLLLQAGDLSLRHADLLGAYRELLDDPAQPWRELPAGEPYIWDHLLHHLRGAGDGSAIRQTATDLAWLATRAFGFGPRAAESDLAQAAELYPDDEVVAWLLRLFTQWGHLLAGHRTLADLAATLASRLDDAPAALVTDALDGLLAAEHLVVRWGTLPRALPALARVLEGEAASWGAVAFSPDGRLVAAGAGGDLIDDAERFAVALWDAGSGEPVATFDGHDEPVSSIAFSPDGGTLASSGRYGARTWDIAGGEPTAKLPGGHVAIAPDGSVLALSEPLGASITLHDAAGATHGGEIQASARKLDRLRLSGAIEGMAFSPNGGLLASAVDDGSVHLWDVGRAKRIAKLDGHEGAVTGVAFSPDERHLASSGEDGSVRLWDVSAGEQVARLDGHGARVTGVAWSPDGLVLASGGWDMTVRLWDPATAKQLTAFEGHTGLVSGVAFSPGGQLVASCGDDGAVRLWDAGQRSHGAGGERRTGAARVAASADGRLVASAGHDGPVRLHDPASGEVVATHEGHTDTIWALAFAPDGAVLASAGEDRTVRLWDVAAGTSRVLEGHRHGVFGLSFTPDGRTLASMDREGEPIRLWDAGSGAEIGRLKTRGASGLNAIAIAPDGRVVAGADGGAGSADADVLLWDLDSGKLTARLRGHRTANVVDGVEAVAFSPDGRTLVSGGGDATVRVWDAVSGEQRALLEGSGGKVTAVAYSPDGHRFATAAEDESVRVIDAATASEVCALRLGLVARGMAWGPAGITLATQRGVLHLRLRAGTEATGLASPAPPPAAEPDPPAAPQPRPGRQPAPEPDLPPSGATDWAAGAAVIAEIRHPEHGRRGRGPRKIADVAFSPDGSRLATAASDGSARLWEIASGLELGCFEHAEPVSAIAFGAGGRLFASAGKDDVAAVWDLAGDRPVARVVHPRDVDALAFRSDGSIVSVTRAMAFHTEIGGDGADVLAGAPAIRFDAKLTAVAIGAGARVVAGADGNRVRAWEVDSGRVLAEVTHGGWSTSVDAVAISPDATLLASAGMDKTARVWSIETGEELCRLEHAGYVVGAAFSPDGCLIATASWDTTAAIWDVRSASPLVLSLPHDGFVTAVAFSPDGCRIATACDDDTARVWDANRMT